MATSIKEAQENRTVTQALGRTVALSVTNEQGQIQTAGYQEQQQSYETMANAAGVAANEEKTAATGAYIGAGISAITGFATLFTGGSSGGSSSGGGGGG